MLPIAEHEECFQKFATLLDRYERFLAQAGTSAGRSSPSEARRLFLGLPAARRERVLARLESELSLFTEVEAAGESLTQSPRLLWRYFVKTGQTPCSDIFDKITDTDVVEVIGLDSQLQFVNLRFFEMVSYTFEQLFCMTWPEATRRDPDVERHMHAMIRRMLSGELLHTFEPGLPRHLVEETDSALLLKREMLIKWASPVFKDKRLDAILVIIDVVPN